jgi:hypothetical protein
MDGPQRNFDAVAAESFHTAEQQGSGHWRIGA